MRIVIIVISAALFLSGCGHSKTSFRPAPEAGMTWEKAVSVIERGFYEDYGRQKPQAVQVTDQAIILSDGTVSTAVHSGTAVPVYGAAVLVGSSQVKTVAAGQHIYLESLLPSEVYKRNGRDNRYAVIVRTDPGVTSRRIYFRSERRAEEFADALEYVRRAAAGRISTQAAQSPSAAMSKEQYRQQQIRQLMEESPPYEEYTRRMREIEAQ